MSRLFKLIDDYREEQGGMSEAAFARRTRLSTQTLNGWRNRGMKTLPQRPVLERLAGALGKDYRVVLVAVLIDLGWEDPPATDTPRTQTEETA